MVTSICSGHNVGVVLVVKEDRTFCHAFVGGVVYVSKFAVDLKFLRSMLPFLSIVVEHTFGLIVCNVDLRCDPGGS